MKMNRIQLETSQLLGITPACEPQKRLLGGNIERLLKQLASQVNGASHDNQDYTVSGNIHNVPKPPATIPLKQLETDVLRFVANFVAEESLCFHPRGSGPKQNRQGGNRNERA